jgi:hypothetical protein
MSQRDDFLAEAIEVLRREIPEGLEWLPWAGLPRLRWAVDRSAVDRRIPKAWLVAAAERGKPEPNAGLRQRAALFDRGDAAVLGTWLLQTWIEHDTAVPELTEARKVELRTIAERAAEMARRFGRGGSDPEERYRQLLAQEGNRPAPSALAHVGLLAVVAAFDGGTAAAEVERYLSTWREERPEQCRALRRMLKSIES